jgi:hypothetical protein
MICANCRNRVSLTKSSFFLATLCIAGVLAASPTVYAQQKWSVCAVGCNFTSIQQAVDAAQSGDTIRIQAGFYQIPWQGPSIILIDQKSLQIKGDGASRTVIQFGEGGGTTRRTAGFRLSCSPPLDLAIEDVTISSLGISTGLANEGCNVRIANSIVENQADSGIYNNGMLTLASSSVTKNHTTGRFGNGSGAGIFNDSQGTLVVKDSKILDNTTGNDCGGGMANYGGSVQLIDSTVANNASAGGCGGGVYNDSGTITATNSHIDFNFLEYAGPRATNRTLFNHGAGIYIASGSVDLRDSFVNQNVLAHSCGDLPCDLGLGAGIFTAAGGTLSLKNSLVLGNQTFWSGSGAGLYTESGATVSVKHGLIISNFNVGQIDNCGGPGFSCP